MTLVAQKINGKVDSGMIEDLKSQLSELEEENKRTKKESADKAMNELSDSIDDLATAVTGLVKKVESKEEMFDKELATKLTASLDGLKGEFKNLITKIKPADLSPIKELAGTILNQNKNIESLISKLNTQPEKKEDNSNQLILSSVSQLIKNNNDLLTQLLNKKEEKKDEKKEEKKHEWVFDITRGQYSDLIQKVKATQIT